jgi:imidazolonepropionase-like amidohydrolase
VSTIWTPSVSRQGAILATNPANLVSGLNANYQEGPPDLVKIIYGTIGIAKEKISPSLLRAAVDWAKEKNLPSVVHIETVQEARDAVDAGAAGIEHAAMIESLPDSLVNAIVAHKTFVDPTFGEYQTALTLQHVERAEIDRRLQQKYGFMRRLYSAGAKIAIGTDAPLVRFGEGFEDEMDHFAKAGFTPAQILTFATQANAEYLGKSNEFGRIAPGYDADFMAVGQNPLEGLGALRKLDFVMFDGEVIGAKR